MLGAASNQTTLIRFNLVKPTIAGAVMVSSLAARLPAIDLSVILARRIVNGRSSYNQAAENAQYGLRPERATVLDRLDAHPQSSAAATASATKRP
jgi:hypothetical protein